MDKKGQKIIAITTIAIIILAGSAFLILQKKEPTPSERIILATNDFVGQGWSDLGGSSFSPPNTPNSSYTTYSTFKNESLEVLIQIWVFDTTQDARHNYNDHVSFQLEYGQNITNNSTLGDALTIVNRTDENGRYGLVLLEANICAFIGGQYLSPDHFSYWSPSWQYDAIVRIANIQFQKINQNLH